MARPKDISELNLKMTVLRISFSTIISISRRLNFQYLPQETKD